MKNFMSENTKRNINLDYVLNDIRPITEYGIKEKQSARPFVKGQEEELLIEFEKIKLFSGTKKRREIIDILKHIKNIHEIMDRANKDQALDIVELFEVKNFLIQSEKLVKSLRGTLITIYEDLKIISLPKLTEILDPNDEKLNTFYIYDDYSKKLRNIRIEKKEAETSIRGLKKEIKEDLYKKYGIRLNLRDEITINKAEQQKIESLLKDENLRVSGENYLNIIFTLKNNQQIDHLEQILEVLTLNEEKEEFKIRKNISAEIKHKYDEIIQNTKAIGRIDFIIAKANHAQKTNSVEPEITTNLELIIKGGRNLKLLEALKERHKEYVPVDVSINKNVVCITGANMGGKTVSLRMIGQIVSSASYGLFVPCEYAKICLFEHIYISVGDDQSIERGLSTFGAEIVNLKESLENSNKRSLILIDELAGGTNPKEGYAITKAVVNYLKKRDCITVITTHYDNVANDEEVQNLQVSGLKLDEKILSAGFIKNIDQISKFMDYRLIEVKYSSFIPKDALNIAKLAGIDEAIIKDAERYL